MKLYTEEHEWVEDTGNGIFRIGVTNYAQEQLGDVVAVELPEVGQEISKGDTCGNIESVKVAEDLQAPISGKVTAINEALTEKPELINEVPETDGWLWDMSADAASLEGLMDESAYQKFIE